MVNFQLESWSAMAPGLETRKDWNQWLQHPEPIGEPFAKIPLKSIPAMLRRRFNTIGKYAVGTALPLVEGIEAIPSIFASRHGDTELSFSLLEQMGRDEPLSPTSFSLAVHNAVGGLFSIARKDTSEVTAIAAMECLVLQTLFEAIGQLQDTNRVLCVIYDVPLAEFYRPYCGDADDLFPFAIAMILSRVNGDSYSLEQSTRATPEEASPANSFDLEPIRLLKLLSGQTNEIEIQQNGVVWRIAKVET